MLVGDEAIGSTRYDSLRITGRRSSNNVEIGPGEIRRKMDAPIIDEAGTELLPR
jgi:hypothetical protein